MNNTFELMPWAISNNDNKIYHINTITRIGASCNCRCIKCNKKVTAVKTSSSKAGFTHQDGSCNCKLIELDINLHDMYCNIFKDLSYIWLPPIDTHYKLGIVGWQKFYIINCELEKSEDNIRPDIILTNDEGRKVRFEIYVTHKIDENKKIKLRHDKKETIEIDLSMYNRFNIPENIIDIIQGQSDNKYWVYNSMQADIEDNIWGNYKILYLNHTEGVQGAIQGCDLHQRLDDYGSKEGKLKYYACKEDCDKCPCKGNNINLAYNGRLTNETNNYIICFPLIFELDDFKISLDQRKQKYKDIIGARYKKYMEKGICQTCGTPLEIHFTNGSYWMGCPNFRNNEKCKKSKISNNTHKLILGYTIEDRNNYK